MAADRNDDLEAVRKVVEALKDFKLADQERIFRWAAEKLGMSPIPGAGGATQQQRSVVPQNAPISSSQADVNQQTPQSGITVDIKSFMAQKKPRSDVQYAAAVAYFYRFEAPASEKKEAIGKDDLQEAARKSGRERFADPQNTLNNALKLGLLDKGPEKGTFTINSVGENLVAMTLPDGAAQKAGSKRKATKKTLKKVTTKKHGSKA